VFVDFEFVSELEPRGEPVPEADGEETVLLDEVLIIESVPVWDPVLVGLEVTMRLRLGLLLTPANSIAPRALMFFSSAAISDTN
jgi:hypothetical protein